MNKSKKKIFFGENKVAETCGAIHLKLKITHMYIKETRICSKKTCTGIINTKFRIVVNFKREEKEWTGSFNSLFMFHFFKKERKKKEKKVVAANLKEIRFFFPPKE